MKIKRLSIYGYGKWIKQTFDFTHPIIVFLGQNEAGKSTIQSFIRHILFGFPKIRKQASYVPKTSSEYGGRLEVEDDQYGDIIIERVRQDKGASTGDVLLFNDKGETLPSLILDELLKKVPLDVYNRFFSLQLAHLHELSNVDKEELNKYFLTIGTNGSDQLFHLRDKWITESKKVYKPSGTVPLLNQKLEELTHLSQRVKQAEDEQVQYLECVNQVEQLQQLQSELKQQANQLKQELYRLEKDLDVYDMQLEYQTLEEQYHKHPSLSLPKDLAQQFERLQIQIEEHQQRLTVFKERIQHEYVQPTEQLQWYINHRDDLKYIVQRMPQIDKVLHRLLQVEFDYATKQELVQKEREKWALKSEDKVPALELVQGDEYVQLKNQSDELMSQRQSLSDNKMQQQLKIDLQTERVLALQQFEKFDQPSGKSLPWLWISLLALGGIILGVGLWLAYLEVSVLGGALCLFSSVGSILSELAYKRRKRELREKKQQFVRQLRREEDCLAGYQADYEQLVQLEHALQMKEEQYHVRENAWKNKHHIPLSLSLLQLSQQSLQELRDLEHEYAQLDHELVQLEKICLTYCQWFRVYQDAFLNVEHVSTSRQLLRMLVTSFKPFMDNMRIEEVRMQEHLTRYQQIQRDIQELELTLTTLTDLKKAMFTQYGVNSQEQFLALLEQEKQQVELSQKRAIFKERLDEATLVRLQQYHSKADLQTMIDKCLQDERLLQEKWQDCHEQLALFKQKKQMFEQSGTYAQLKQHYTMLENEVIELVEQVGELLVSAQLVEVLLQSGKQTHLEQVINDAQAYFSCLTNGRYTRLQFSTSVLKVVCYDKTIFELKELSQGTLEQLYVAIRLAFIKNISQVLNLPILIDDCFVNFDVTRRAAMYRILQELSETHQIFYFTFNSEITQVIEELQTITLKV